MYVIRFFSRIAESIYLSLYSNRVSSVRPTTAHLVQPLKHENVNIYQQITGQKDTNVYTHKRLTNIWLIYLLFQTRCVYLFILYNSKDNFKFYEKKSCDVGKTSIFQVVKRSNEKVCADIFFEEERFFVKILPTKDDLINPDLWKYYGNFWQKKKSCLVN